MDHVFFNVWELLVDKEYTQKMYEQTGAGGAETCTCGNCARYVQIRDSLIPKILKDLFNKLGIDYRKDTEVMTIDLENGFHDIYVSYTFRGEVIGTTRRQVRESLKHTGSWNFTPVAENLSMSFKQSLRRTLFTDDNNQVELTFCTRVAEK